MPRFLHTADWQIGRQYSQFPSDDAVPLAQARLAAVQTLARLATEHAVDAVLVAGDVFDAQTVAERTIRQLLRALQGYAGPWIMIPGNHDAALSESVWTRARRLQVLPDNLHLALSSQQLDFPELGFSVLAAPLTQRHTYNDLTEWFDHARTPEGLLRIGIAHGSVQGILAPDIDSANPIAADRAIRARLDYLALGDWHGCKQIDARTWYSGTPETDRFRGNEPGFALRVDIDGPGATPQVQRIATGQYRWQEWQQTIAVSSDVQALASRLAAVQTHDVVDIRLDGQVDLASLEHLQAALRQAESVARSLRVDLAALQLAPTADDIAALHADGYLGEVITELRGMQQQDASDSGQAAVARHALGLLTRLLGARRGEGPGA